MFTVLLLFTPTNLIVLTNKSIEGLFFNTELLLSSKSICPPSSALFCFSKSGVFAFKVPPVNVFTPLIVCAVSVVTVFDTFAFASNFACPAAERLDKFEFTTESTEYGSNEFIPLVVQETFAIIKDFQ